MLDYVSELKTEGRGSRVGIWSFIGTLEKCAVCAYMCVNVFCEVFGKCSGIRVWHVVLPVKWCCLL